MRSPMPVLSSWTASARPSSRSQSCAAVVERRMPRLSTTSIGCNIESVNKGLSSGIVYCLLHNKRQLVLRLGIEFCDERFRIRWVEWQYGLLFCCVHVKVADIDTETVRARSEPDNRGGARLSNCNREFRSLLAPLFRNAVFRGDNLPRVAQTYQPLL